VGRMVELGTCGLEVSGVVGLGSLVGYPGFICIDIYVWGFGRVINLICEIFFLSIFLLFRPERDGRFF
jgi:hypothetical protein